jgi:uncharacterized protein (TIGR02145 family)
VFFVKPYICNSLTNMEPINLKNAEMNCRIKFPKPLYLLLILILLSTSCKKASLPSVKTGSVSRILQTSAYASGQLVNDGGAHVSSLGVCWNTSPDPDISNHTSPDSTLTGLFTSHLTGLTANTLYYVKAYATNSEGTSYGETVTFTTDPVALATLITSGLKSLTPSTAMGGGDIANEGGIPVTDRGVCWNTTGAPTTDDNHTSDGTGEGIFSSTLTDLTIGTTYYVRAYAVNSIGTAYGNEMIYTQIEPITDIDGNAYSIVTIGTQIWLGENLKTTRLNDGSAISNITEGKGWNNATTPAYCWYNNDEADFKSTYGALYNWYSVNTGKLCPAGWHMPSSDEFNTMLIYLGGENVAGGKLKESGTSHWEYPNSGATNGSGFTAVPGGGRYNIYSNPGAFSDLGYGSYMWTATQSPVGTNAYSFDLIFNQPVFSKNEYSKSDGGSVRCIKDTR